jgi:hypothetical protein
MLALVKILADFGIDLFIAFALRLQCKGATAKIPLIVKNRFSTRSV